MANHIKPTKEELKAKAEKALKDAEELEKNPPAPSPSAGVPSASPSEALPTASPSEAVPSATPSVSPSAPASSTSVSPSPSPEDDELTKTKKKASASAREAQVLQSRTKKYDEAVEMAEKVEPPTDEEMETRYGKEDWNAMSEGSKQIARDAYVSNKRFEIMSAASKEGRDIQEWNKKVDTFLGDPKSLNKYQELEGKQEDFKEFCMKPSRRGLDFDDLVLAFNGELARNPKQKKKGQMFEKGQPGRKETPRPNDGSISAAAGRQLRKSDYKKWKEMLKAKKIRPE